MTHVWCICFKLYLCFWLNTCLISLFQFVVVQCYGKCPAGSILFSADVNSNHRTTNFVSDPTLTCRKIQSTAYYWSALLLKRALCFLSCRFSLIRLLDGKARSEGVFLCMAGVCTTRSREQHSQCHVSQWRQCWAER